MKSNIFGVAVVAIVLAVVFTGVNRQWEASSGGDDIDAIADIMAAFEPLMGVALAVAAIATLLGYTALFGSSFGGGR